MVSVLGVGGAAGQGTPGNMQDAVTETTRPRRRLVSKPAVLAPGGFLLYEDEQLKQ